MRHIAANAMTLLIVGCVLLAGAIAYGVNEFNAEGPAGEDVTIMVPRGGSLNDVADELAAKGVISDARIFRLGARYRNVAGDLKFGEYLVPAHASMADVLDQLVEGRTVQHRITVAEGLTSWAVVQLLDESDVLTGEIEEVPPEGSLAPDTYFVQRGEARDAVLARMKEAQDERLRAAWKERAPDLPLANPEEALILASIVEKETAIPDERPLVAAVFINRLKKGMKLQTDPTVIYGITGGKGPLGRGIRRSELDAATPYNTYQVAGLPPTPIANPGKEAIEATVNPADTDYLYFVADGNGGHVFSSTLQEHNRNVVKWRRIEQEQANGASGSQ